VIRKDAGEDAGGCRNHGVTWAMMMAATRRVEYLN